MEPIIIISVPRAKPADAGYVERLRAALEREKTSNAALTTGFIERGRVIEKYWQRIEAQDLEINQLKHQGLELGRQNIALAAQAEQVDQLESQLAIADQHMAELEAALRLAQMSADSRDNVIELIRRTAA